MASKTTKPPAAATVEANAAPISDSPALDIDLEDLIADELLNDLDWTKVRAALITKAKERFFSFFTSGNDRPINISAFPELTAIEGGSDDEVKAS